MAEPKDWISPANLFLQTQVYRLGTNHGLCSLPLGPERDFLLLTWGPVIYRTTYAPDSQRLIPIFLRALNEEIRKALPRCLPGSPDQIRQLERTYSSKVFSSQETYHGVDEIIIREAFHDWKISLALTSSDLPVRLRMCLLVDDGVLSFLTGMLDSSTLVEKEPDFSKCPVKVIEENFLALNHVDSNSTEGKYLGWTTVTLSSLVEIYNGMQQGKCLADYHKEGRVYLGDNKWK
ncbi:hypothetical protein ASPWEDRAFT_171717 [Aspergillus wentii DTO 134E9]|uniref:Uncharacterized protein n=1 Tax=Aspergillus wentii DTO 134E9 TaxID=1073089 RepID=A0A1L9RIX1_ASPWE|nr:uncharacterized protein ASPWEDRAFT_171717 [Aspergillus wentii DTO 134E9]OJJ34886.1 hypothetical protein ASPWEDRAFT_171717 [Aspergillus wentii DTO 134E9]